MRDSCIFYRSFFEALKGLDKEIKSDVYDAIFEYSLNGNEIDLDGIKKTIFTLVKPQLDANNKRFENGKKGGKPKLNETELKPKRNQNVTKNEPKENQEITKNEANKNDNVNNNENVNHNINENNNSNENGFLFKKETKTKNIVFPFKKKLIEYGFLENLVDDWLLVRKTKKATNTETAFKSFITEIEKRNCNINDMLQIAVTNSWSGFKHTWVDNLKNTNNGKSGNNQSGNTTPTTDELAEQSYNAVARLLGKTQ